MRSTRALYIFVGLVSIINNKHLVQGQGGGPTESLHPTFYDHHSVHARPHDNYERRHDFYERPREMHEKPRDLGDNAKVVVGSITAAGVGTGGVLLLQDRAHTGSKFGAYSRATTVEELNKIKGSQSLSQRIGFSNESAALTAEYIRRRNQIENSGKEDVSEQGAVKAKHLDIEFKKEQNTKEQAKLVEAKDKIEERKKTVEEITKKLEKLEHDQKIKEKVKKDMMAPLAISKDSARQLKDFLLWARKNADKQKSTKAVFAGVDKLCHKLNLIAEADISAPIMDYTDDGEELVDVADTFATAGVVISNYVKECKTAKSVDTLKSMFRRYATHSGLIPEFTRIGKPIQYPQPETDPAKLFAQCLPLIEPVQLGDLNQEKANIDEHVENYLKSHDADSLMQAIKGQAEYVYNLYRLFEEQTKPVPNQSDVDQFLKNANAGNELYKKHMAQLGYELGENEEPSLATILTHAYAQAKQRNFVDSVDSRNDHFQVIVDLAALKNGIEVEVATMTNAKANLDAINTQRSAAYDYLADNFDELLGKESVDVDKLQELLKEVFAGVLEPAEINIAPTRRYAFNTYVEQLNSLEAFGDSMASKPKVPATKTPAVVPVTAAKPVGKPAVAASAG